MSPTKVTPYAWYRDGTNLTSSAIVCPFFRACVLYTTPVGHRIYLGVELEFTGASPYSRLLVYVLENDQRCIMEIPLRGLVTGNTWIQATSCSMNSI